MSRFSSQLSKQEDEEEEAEEDGRSVRQKRKARLRKAWTVTRVASLTTLVVVSMVSYA